MVILGDDLKIGGKDILDGELCLFCNNKTLTLTETIVEVPYFGVIHIFAMDCSSCHYHKTDLEAEKTKEPCKFTFLVETEDDLKTRVVKSGNATIKIPHIGSIEPGEASNGYITNIEGIINRFKKMIDSLREESEDPADHKKAKNMLKKLNKALMGHDTLKISLEDPSGNSAIISEKAEKKKL